MAMERSKLESVGRSCYTPCTDLLERWGADLWAERITHRYERDQVVRSSQMRGSDREPNNPTG